MSIEEMQRQERLPFSEQSEEFLRICVRHGSPCCIHGKKCNHTPDWLRLQEHIFHRMVRCRRDIALHRFLEEFHRGAIYSIEWGPTVRFSLVEWTREGSYVVRNKDKKRLLEGLETAISEGLISYIPDPELPQTGLATWNVTHVPNWQGEIPGYKKSDYKKDRVLLTIDQLIAEGKLSDTWNQRLPANEWTAIRTLVLDRDDHTCQYCGVRGVTMHIDHIMPISRGGSNHPDNLVTACEACNSRKHAKTPEEWLS